jgi:hypothetical protein
MADVAAEGEFDLVYAVFNTFYAMPSQDERARCFANVAPRSKPAGAFVIQAFVFDQTTFQRGQRVQATGVETGAIAFDVAKHDPLASDRPSTAQPRSTSLGRARRTPGDGARTGAWPEPPNVRCLARAPPTQGGVAPAALYCRSYRPRTQATVTASCRVRNSSSTARPVRRRTSRRGLEPG